MKIGADATKVGGALYHRECFKCESCSTPLTGSFFRVNGKLTCETCKTNPGSTSTKTEQKAAAPSEPKPATVVEDGPRCRVCKKSISKGEKQVVADRDDRFHEECFKCADCGTGLTNYVILDNRKFKYQECRYYCEACAGKIEDESEKGLDKASHTKAKSCAVCGGACGGEEATGDAFQLMDGCVLHWSCFRCSACGKAEEAPSDFEGQMRGINLLRTKVGSLLQGRYRCDNCSNTEVSAPPLKTSNTSAPKSAAAPKASGYTSAAAPIAPLAAATPLAPNEFLSLKDLTNPDVWKARGIPAEGREVYLSDADFAEAFGTSKDEFAKMPAWKKAQQKKALGLF